MIFYKFEYCSEKNVKWFVSSFDSKIKAIAPIVTATYNNYNKDVLIGSLSIMSPAPKHTVLSKDNWMQYLTQFSSYIFEFDNTVLHGFSVGDTLSFIDLTKKIDIKFRTLSPIPYYTINKNIF